MFFFIYILLKYLPRLIDDWKTIAPKYCNGTRQSPINIVSAKAESDDKLTEFTFFNYSSADALISIENTGKTSEFKKANKTEVKNKPKHKLLICSSVHF